MCVGAGNLCCNLQVLVVPLLAGATGKADVKPLTYTPVLQATGSGGAAPGRGHGEGRREAADVRVSADGAGRGGAAGGEGGRHHAQLRGRLELRQCGLLWHPGGCRLLPWNVSRCCLIV